VYDVTSTALHAALRGLSARRDAVAGNIANVETAGYLAQRVDFEASLAAALDDVSRGGPAGGEATVLGVRPESATSTDPTRLNGNNVSLDDEIITQEQTELAYAAVLEGMNAKFRLLRTSIDGGR
jgi:flagellar basal-body rod protein FlgB